MLEARKAGSSVQCISLRLDVLLRLFCVAAGMVVLCGDEGIYFVID